MIKQTHPHTQAQTHTCQYGRGNAICIGTSDINDEINNGIDKIPGSRRNNYSKMPCLVYCQWLSKFILSSILNT